MMGNLSLIFPMAGQGARFGYRFKPFLEVQGRTFIEAAFAPFRAWLPRIAGVTFVFTAEQEAEHNVTARLGEMFYRVPHQAVVLEQPTEGPAQTLGQCLESRGISGPIMVCDCDHAVDVTGLMEAAESSWPCAVPTWPLKGEPLTAWSVAAIAGDGRITAVAEKALPPRGEDFRGIIGCYYFADAAQVRRSLAAAGTLHVSDVIRHYLETGVPVLSVPTTHAQFFGDPARLAKIAAAS